ncbi:cytochrome c biogenesis protein CcsA [bacterium]|jgi:ABC-type transport system involved in cytochrome c biogenesis permease subunit|nr:cytochrome c biogenesis protein CcsA [bacterium]
MPNKTLKLAWLGIGILLIVTLLIPETNGPFKIKQFGELPVLEGGRIKPLDTIARNALLMIQGKQTIRTQPKSLTSIEWFLLLSTHPEKADALEIFVVEHPQLFGSLGDKYQKQKYRVSFNFLKEHHNKIITQSSRALEMEPGQRTPYQKQIIALNNRLMLYFKLKNTFKPENNPQFTDAIQSFQQNLPNALDAIKTHSQLETLSQEKKKLISELNMHFKDFQMLSQTSNFYPIPPFGSKTTSDWKSVGDSLLQSLDITIPLNPAVMDYSKMLSAYANNDSNGFNSALASHRNLIQSQFPKLFYKSKTEAFFNHASLFYRGILLYGLALIILIISWIKAPRFLGKLAYGVVSIGFLSHTIGLLSRMLLHGRPPVTNLYSSAIFVGWVAVFLGLLIEKRLRNSIALFATTIIGILTLIIAHHLAMSGDTLEMMQAVLDSNFWLSTHVVTITMGYAAVAMAGMFASIYILMGFLTKRLKGEREKTLRAMVYGSIGLALTLSFIGTVLGGIWADQSWGRFWGWDPKENGSILIVLWMAICLHARFAGLVRTQGFMVAAVFGNIVFVWSWFGVNMLGIGLHSYGFMDKSFIWLVGFAVSQLIIMLIGTMPLSIWTSFRDEGK